MYELKTRGELVIFSVFRLLQQSDRRLKRLEEMKLLLACTRFG